MDTLYILKAALLSMEAGVFSAMALNAFVEAQNSLHLALSLLGKVKVGRNSPSPRLKAEVLHELGRVYRYQGSYTESERSLLESLEISQQVSRKDPTMRKFVADTLHELGVLEVKKHNLDSAAQFLQRSLELRQSLRDTESDSVNASCAATLHQLAATYVARKPPSLEKAKTLLQDALKMCRQIGQRAATLKQLARVTIRQGKLDQAETYLEQALELYLELYGDNKLHINIASVKFQQGALAIQREQLDEAWLHFSECLRIRRYVYAYARQAGVVDAVSAKRKSSADTNPIHLEVSAVLHELGTVGFAQGRFSQAFQMLLDERAILENLNETTSQSNRIYQARLTCLTWLRKCAKELGDDSEAERFTQERTAMKKEAGLKTKDKHLVSDSVMLQHKVIDCRLLARQFALDKSNSNIVGKEKLLNVLSELQEEISLAPSGSMTRAATQFHETMMLWIEEPISKRRVPILKACDSLRDILRAHGVQVVDSMIQKNR
jgi:tetratricopeptide (TPR) repeat protein